MEIDEKNKLTKLVLFGAGGLGREIAVLIKQINNVQPTFNLLGFIVDKEYYKAGQIINGLPVLGTSEWLLARKEEISCAVCIGDAKSRQPVFERLREAGVRLEKIIAPDVYIDETTSVGEGTIIGIRCLVSPNVKIGNGVFLNSDVTLGHDVVVDDCATLYPRCQISGNCFIGKAAQLGSGVFLNKGVKIGERAVVAPMSAVYGKVKPDTHVMGNPATRLDL